MPRALILGGTGPIGRAAAGRLLADGWRVDVTGRDPRRMPDGLRAAGARFLVADRSDPAQLKGAVRSGADLIVDCLCYTAADARLLLRLAEHATSTVLISSRAVYVDAHGNHANSAIPPRFDGPVRETQPTMTPGDMDHRSPEGYGANKAAAERTALDSGLPVTVIRPGLVHGPGAANPREWVLVKRILDRRATVLLADGGRGVVHTTAAANLAALIATVAERPGTRILNCADPDAPSALEISRTVAGHLGHSWREVLLDATAPEWLGRTPWDAPHPVVLDMSAAHDLGYRPAGSYARTVAAELDWLLRAARTGDPAGILPAADDPSFAPFLDYAAEDAYLAGSARS
ncbi:NAD(P)H-binding protein [Streptomyces sp. NPDC003077]|uniref:NAD-dependent epimerase/dehydratase family protein n=1 Tax=Streptomyces sp. NPDC003077 TaxID=3154443 RepID=UPI0033BAA799